MRSTTTTPTQYGSYTHGTPFLAERTYCRHDTYHTRAAPDLDGHKDLVWCAGPQDDSPLYLGPYDAKCASCWLNHGHTTQRHAGNTEKGR